ncbi:MAG: hypothetical protein ACE1ZA_15910, partial [Pseudomonadales bacterium]
LVDIAFPLRALSGEFFDFLGGRREGIGSFLQEVSRAVHGKLRDSVYFGFQYAIGSPEDE